MFSELKTFPFKELFYKPEVTVAWAIARPLSTHILSFVLLVVALIGFSAIFEDAFTLDSFMSFLFLSAIMIVLLPLMMAFGSVIYYLAARILGGNATFIQVFILTLYLSFPSLVSLPFDESLIQLPIAAWLIYLFSRAMMFLQGFSIARTFAYLGILILLVIGVSVVIVGIGMLFA